MSVCVRHIFSKIHLFNQHVLINDNAMTKRRLYYGIITKYVTNKALIVPHLRL